MTPNQIAKFPVAAAFKLSLHDIVALLIVVTALSLMAFGGNEEARGTAGVFLIAFIAGYEFARMDGSIRNTPSISASTARRVARVRVRKYPRGSITGPVREALRTHDEDLTVRQIADKAGLAARLPSVAAAVSRMLGAGEVVAGEAPNSYRAAKP